MKRNIIEIDEQKCNGCGLCVKACHEGAIEIIDGKAKLVSEEYCDGLGDCLPECPTGAIRIVEKESKPYDEKAVSQRLKQKQEKQVCLSAVCPGSMSRIIKNARNFEQDKSALSEQDISSQLSQWPIQLKLVNTDASYFNDADILIAADCTAYAYANFHRDFIKGRITLIGCPKLDNNDYYREKITNILKKYKIKSITVVRMTVPCCRGISSAVKNAMLDAEVIVPYNEVVVGIDGSIQK